MNKWGALIFANGVILTGLSGGFLVFVELHPLARLGAAALIVLGILQTWASFDGANYEMERRR